MQVENQRFHDRDCTYVIYVQTGDVQNAGTYATVSLELRDIYTNRVNITNLRSWGLMGGSWHDYFRRGNLDAFAGKGKCLEGPVCSITLSHDNSSIGPGWYVDFVDVTSVAPHGSCRKVRFPVNAWLAFDEPPYYSTRRGVYLCDEVVSGEKGHKPQEIWRVKSGFKTRIERVNGCRRCY